MRQLFALRIIWFRIERNGLEVMEKLAGYVEHIIYRNTDNGYTVLNLVSGEDEITCVGIFSTIAEGENIEATGDYTDHPTYGTQFKW